MPTWNTHTKGWVKRRQMNGYFYVQKNFMTISVVKCKQGLRFVWKNFVCCCLSKRKGWKFLPQQKFLFAYFWLANPFSVDFTKKLFAFDAFFRSGRYLLISDLQFLAKNSLLRQTCTNIKTDRNLKNEWRRKSYYNLCDDTTNNSHFFQFFDYPVFR